MKSTGTINKIVNIFESIVNVASFCAGLLLGLAALTVTIDIVMRYFFNKPITGVLESTEYGLLFFTLLAAPWLLKMDKHVKMDLLLSKLQKITQARIYTVTSCFGFAICSLIAYYGIVVTIDRFQTGHRMPTTLEPLSYPIVSIIPICFLMLAIEFVIVACRYALEAQTLSTVNTKEKAER